MLLVLPVHLSQGLTISGLFVGPLQHGVPTSFGAKGELANGDRAAVLAYDWPQEWREATKGSAELRMIERFRADYDLLVGTPRYDDIAQGRDPPDFTCGVRGARLGVEMTQLLITERVTAAALFRKIRLAALGHRAEAFRHLSGHMIYVSFPESTGLPPNRPDQIKKLVRSLSSMHPPDIASSDISAPPEHLPVETHRVQLSGGATATAARLASDPGGLLYARAGIELGLAFSSTISVSQCWEELGRLITKHDQAGVDDLIIAAGAPIASGLAFPSDTLLAELILDGAEDRSLAPPEHIKRVYIHDWWKRTIHLLIPGETGAQRPDGTE